MINVSAARMVCNIDMKELYAIGHVTNDLEPEPHVGGAAPYSALTAHRLGMVAHIITEAPPEHPYLDELAQAGLIVHRLQTVDQSKESSITSFRNFYDNAGHRHQIVSNRQDDINSRDLGNFPYIPPGSVIFVTPVIGEVNPEIFPDLSENGYLVVAPQGYFRHSDSSGDISCENWTSLDSLKQAEITILSDEDISFDGEPDTACLDSIRKTCPIVVLTQGSEGLTVFVQGDQTIHVKAFGMTPDEIVSPTGAGDSCAAAFVWHYLKWGKLKEAAVFGAFYPALKLMGIGGEQRGIHALPELSQIKRYVDLNKERFDAYLASNQLKKLPI